MRKFKSSVVLVALFGSAVAACALETQKTQPVEVENIVEKKAVLEDGSEVTMVTTSKTTVQVQAGSTKKLPRKAVVFVRNNAGKEFDGGLVRMQDQIVAQASGPQFEIIDPRESVFAIDALAEALPMADGTAQMAREEIVQQGAAMNRSSSGKPTADGRGATMDEKLKANTSITRLAQNMDADYLLVLTLDKFTKSKKTYKSRDLDSAVTTETYLLSASYKVLDAYSGASIGGNTLKASKSLRQTEGLQQEPGDFADGLDDELVDKLKDDILKNERKWREASKALSGIPVQFVVQAYNMDNSPIYLPRYDGEKKMLNDLVPAQLMANVEVDGLSVGSTPCTVQLAPGMHKVRITRQGYDDITLAIKPRDGLIVSVAMRMTEGEMSRLRSSIEFMQRMTKEREISQALVERLQGEAQMLRNSGIKVDAKEMPKIEMKSLY
ncbi:MAG: PEGA domain-containing protein [Kiritimatiellae bacterium]|nr:PEGA domain-containing protein [Kiritimatiellia bacterium]